MATVIQQPGFGDSIRKGLAPLIQALQFRQRAGQRQQALDTQKQQVELQGLAQRNQQRQRGVANALQLVRMLGPGILEDPSLQQKLQEDGINPQTVMQKFKEEQDAEQKRSLALQHEAKNAVPPEMRPAVDQYFKAVEAGMAPGGATVLMQNLLQAAEQQLTPEQRERLAEKYPALFGPDSDMPFDVAMKALADHQVARYQMANSYGPEWARQFNVGLTQTRQAIADLQLTDMINSPSTPDLQRMRAAMALDDLLQGMVDAADPGMRANPATFRAWGRANLQTKITMVLGSGPRKAAILTAWKAVPGILAETLESLTPKVP